MNTSTLWQKYMQILEKVRAYEEALALLQWDQQTIASVRGRDFRAETIGVFAAKVFSLTTSDTVEQLLGELQTASHWETLSPMQRRSIQVMHKAFVRARAIPEKMHQDFVVLCALAQNRWEHAREQRDFTLFCPTLLRIVEMKREMIPYIHGQFVHPYDALLDGYEPGMTVEKLDRIFGQLRERLIPLIAEIQLRQRATHNDPWPHVPIEVQRAFQPFLLTQMGFDPDIGQLAQSVHPFMITINPYDIRITTRYEEADFTSALFSTLHEGGHALYEQHIDSALHATNLATGASMAVHESQSRLWENIIGRSPVFWEAYYPELIQRIPQLQTMSFSTFYAGINRVAPTLIRTDADEVTYNVHIFIRYACEKQLIAGTIRVEDLPEFWHDAYAQNLGVTPSNDATGVLQDVHWSGGDFGYFPSYALGNLMAAQLWDTLKKDVPQWETHMRNRDLIPLKTWLTKHVYAHGSMYTPEELLVRVTGNPLDSEHFLSYVAQKFGIS